MFHTMNSKAMTTNSHSEIVPNDLGGSRYKDMPKVKEDRTQDFGDGRDGGRLQSSNTEEKDKPHSNVKRGGKF